MSRITRRHISFAFVVVFVFVAVLVPAAIAGNGGVQPTSPWYAYDAALRKAQEKRHDQSVKSETAGVQPTSPWYAYDAALRKAQEKRHEQSAGIRVITDTLGGTGSAPKRTPQAKVTGSLSGSAIPNKAQ
ncbi:MAG TPA: hypothetical protein VMB53_14470 [Gaiellaceae bacterium]|nr:hypothetical protein [Gaiellaceae bacterium]